MALTGYVQSGICYSTLTEAVDSHFQSVSPVVLASGSTVYFQKNVPLNLWQRVEVTAPPSIYKFTAVAVPSFPPCDPASAYNDGMVLGWGVVFSMLAVVSFAQLYKATR